MENCSKPINRLKTQRRRRRTTKNLENVNYPYLLHIRQRKCIPISNLIFRSKYCFFLINIPSNIYLVLYDNIIHELPTFPRYVNRIVLPQFISKLWLLNFEIFRASRATQDFNIILKDLLRYKYFFFKWELPFINKLLAVREIFFF